MRRFMCVVPHAHDSLYLHYVKRATDKVLCGGLLRSSAVCATTLGHENLIRLIVSGLPRYCHIIYYKMTTHGPVF